MDPITIASGRVQPQPVIRWTSKLAKTPATAHNLLHSTKDLHELLQAVAPQGSKPRRLVFVAASISIHLARFYAQHYPEQLAGLLILNSSIGNKELSDIWPNTKAQASIPEMLSPTIVP